MAFRAVTLDPTEHIVLRFYLAAEAIRRGSQYAKPVLVEILSEAPEKYGEWGRELAAVGKRGKPWLLEVLHNPGVKWEVRAWAAEGLEEIGSQGLSFEVERHVLDPNEDLPLRHALMHYLVDVKRSTSVFVLASIALDESTEIILREKAVSLLACLRRPTSRAAAPPTHRKLSADLADRAKASLLRLRRSGASMDVPFDAPAPDPKRFRNPIPPLRPPVNATIVGGIGYSGSRGIYYAGDDLVTPLGFEALFDHYARQLERRGFRDGLATGAGTGLRRRGDSRPNLSTGEGCGSGLHGMLREPIPTTSG